MSPQERLDDRRERLLAAALQRFGTEGYAATTIDVLCADAKISTRAFYECFSSRKTLLAALFDRLVTEAIAAVRTAWYEDTTLSASSLVRAGVAAYIDYMTIDVRRARIIHIEVQRAGDPLQAARRLSVYQFAALIVSLTEGQVTLNKAPVERVAIGLIGAVQELITDWVGTEPRPAPADVLAGAQHIFVAALGPRDLSPASGPADPSVGLSTPDHRGLSDL